jgi:hypothetical protein
MSVVCQKQGSRWQNVESQLLLDKKQNAAHSLETFTETLQNFDSVENVEADSNSFIHLLYFHIVTYATLDPSDCILQNYNTCTESSKL